MENKKITIAICTYNRVKLLKECLLSFTPEYQNFDKEMYEILIIDNNSSDSTQELAKEFSNKYTNYRVVIETNQGLSYARNRAYKEAKGEWIAYIDDDARGHKNYLHQLLKDIINFSFDAIGGPCIPLYHEDKPKWYKDSYQSSKKLSQLGKLENDFIVGFNSVFRKSILESIGGFNTSIGMNGNKVAYGEETEVQIKIRQIGGIVFFDPNLLVNHYIDSYKLNLFWFIKSNYAVGRDSWQTFRITPNFLNIFKAFLGIFFYFAKSILVYTPTLMIRKNFYYQNFIIEVLSKPSMNLGRVIAGVKLLMVFKK